MYFLTLTRRSKRRLLGFTALMALLILGIVLLRPPPQTAVPVIGAPQPLRNVATSRREIALTFDLSWGTVMPPKVLAVLEQQHVRATFFLSGPWAKDHPDLVRRIVAGGFQIESHGSRHVNYSGLSAKDLRRNIEDATADIQAASGIRPTMLRPPNGDYNGQTLQVASSLGYTVVLWGTDSRDWLNPGVSNIVHRVLAKAHPGDIVLLHASDTCKQTDQALPAIIRGLRDRGYRLVTLKELLAGAASP